MTVMIWALRMMAFRKENGINAERFQLQCWQLNEEKA